MAGTQTSAFQTLYPDINPAQGLPLALSERLALSCAIAVLAYGGVSGTIVVASAGLAFVLFCAVSQSFKTARRVRTEARNRFPQELWAEYSSLRHLQVLVVSSWLLVTAAIAATWWFTPAAHLQLAAIIAAIISALAVWFMPGINPLWSRKRDTEDVEVTETNVVNGDTAQFAAVPQP